MTKKVVECWLYEVLMHLLESTKLATGLWYATKGAQPNYCKYSARALQSLVDTLSTPSSPNFVSRSPRAENTMCSLLSMNTPVSAPHGALAKEAHRGERWKKMGERSKVGLGGGSTARAVGVAVRRRPATLLVR